VAKYGKSLNLPHFTFRLDTFRALQLSGESRELVAVSQIQSTYGKEDMSNQRFTKRLVRTVGFLGLLLLMVAPIVGDKPQPEIAVPFEPTPPQVVDEMLKLGNVTADDVVYDLGCGDGRIVIAAAQKLKARGFGVDLDPQRIDECKENAESAGVADRLQFKVGDIMQTDLAPATVVTLYLLDEVNLMLRPKLFHELKPGTRIVSHAFHMADWRADKTEHPPKARNEVIYLWILPASVGGVWQWTGKNPQGATQYRLDLEQEFQVVRGELTSGEGKKAPISNVSLNGRELLLSAQVADGQRQVRVNFRGTVDGDTIKGTQQWRGGSRAGTYEWIAQRTPVDLSGSWRIKVQASEEPLDGVLRVERKNGDLKATYVGDKDKKDIALTGFIAWGTSVYFNIPAEDKSPIFTGSLSGNTGNGKVTREGTSATLVWTGQREK